ncbi:sensor histidine kinase [Natronosporangium hydrolyticum]|uniref:histidine kinase n=1 Tax=Natronosporangium hydrolyticum TaxID=2811111 RepID=A0A895Y4J5_9ACTN|nr:histidine kinase [Natronosporangium hydrolyticum]QSB12617.1 sensor histidine kinase [Natronosporangium hydrolyticum]
MSEAAPVRVPQTGPVRRCRRDWLTDGAAWLFATGWTALVAWLWWSDWVPATSMPSTLMIVDVATGVVASAAVWLRRRWPVTLAVALVPTGMFSMATAAAAMVALFTVAVRRRPAVTLLIGGAYAATALPYFGYQLNPLQPQAPYWWDVLWACVVTALVVGWGLFARARVQLLQSLHDRAVRAESEQHLRAERARQLERERIAREMHDVLAHRISLVSMHAGGLEYRRDASPEEITRAAGIIRRSAHEALADLRGIVGVLRTAPTGDLRPQPTLAELPALVEQSRLAGVRVRWNGRLDGAESVPEQLGRDAYRIVQEGLTNARKHAAGATVDLSVTGAAGGELVIEVTNPAPVGGGGAPEIPGTGTGLVGLAERAELAGGRLEHGPAPGGGYRLRAWLPWPA